MKKILSLCIVLLLVISGCSSQKNQGKVEEKAKLSKEQQQDVEIAKKLYEAGVKLEKAKNFHMTGYTQHGDYYDVNIRKEDYAGTYTHISKVNGVPQEMTDYIHQKGKKEATYITYTGKIMPFSNNFGTYMRDMTVDAAKSYKDVIPTEKQEKYKAIFKVSKKKNGSMTIQVAEDKSKRVFTLTKSNYISAYKDEMKQSFTANQYNKVELDYSRVGL